MRFEPYKLSEISGITSSKATQISEEFNKEWQLWQIVIFLQKYDIGATNSNRVYKELGYNAIDRIKENPYILLGILNNVGFETIDRMAISLGIDYNSSFRVKSGIKYALYLSARNGNTCSNENELISFVSNILRVPEELIENEITSLSFDKEVFKEDGFVFLDDYYETEDLIARRVMMLCNDQVKKCINIEKKLEDIEEEIGIELSDEQKNAIKMAMNNKICIITGGPGTGKTTIIKTIIKLLEIEKKEIALCAPTGRAAKRIKETTGEDAKTLHRLLMLGKTEEDHLAVNYEVPKINQEVVIVDEVSMVDTLLMNYLLRALKEKTRLILIGDSDQLPSVGAGNVLKDLIESDLVPVSKLSHIYRQAQESDIVMNAHKINLGERIDLNKKDNDFFFINGTNILNQVSELVEKRINNYGNYDSLKDIQILTPTKKGDSGTRFLNKKLQEVLNPASPSKKEKTYGSVTFREGDKVMQVKNNYDLYWESPDGKSYGSGVYNGDLGVITSVQEEGLKVLFDDEKEIFYTGDSLDELEHAYAITVHKSQGSEFPVVVMPLVSGPPMLYTRNLLYTGVTRAKEMLVIVGDSGVVYNMINNNNTKRRNTGLKHKLQKYFELFKNYQ